MAIEDRRGVCFTCDGPIIRYPHPGGPAKGDRWVHKNREDWIDSPHEATPLPPKEDATQ